MLPGTAEAPGACAPTLRERAGFLPALCTDNSVLNQHNLNSIHHTYAYLTKGLVAAREDPAVAKITSSMTRFALVHELGLVAGRRGMAQGDMGAAGLAVCLWTTWCTGSGVH